jgi:hypothetical protein
MILRSSWRRSTTRRWAQFNEVWQIALYFAANGFYYPQSIRALQILHYLPILNLCSCALFQPTLIDSKAFPMGFMGRSDKSKRGRPLLFPGTDSLSGQLHIHNPTFHQVGPRYTKNVIYLFRNHLNPSLKPSVSHTEPYFFYNFYRRRRILSSAAASSPWHNLNTSRIGLEPWTSNRLPLLVLAISVWAATETTTHRLPTSILLNRSGLHQGSSVLFLFLELGLLSQRLEAP